MRVWGFEVESCRDYHLGWALQEFKAKIQGRRILAGAVVLDLGFRVRV